MEDSKLDTRRIAEEAVGERPGSAIPDAAKEKFKTAPEDVIRRAASSVGSEASVAAKTAESVGERAAGAYAYPNATTDEVQKSSRITRPAAMQAGYQSREQPLAWMVASFAVGYAVSLLIHKGR